MSQNVIMIAIQTTPTKLSLYENNHALIQFQVENTLSKSDILTLANNSEANGSNDAQLLHIEVPEQTINSSVVVTTCDSVNCILLPVPFVLPSKIDTSLSSSNSWKGKSVIITDHRGKQHRGIIVSLTDEKCLLYKPNIDQLVWIRNYVNLVFDLVMNNNVGLTEPIESNNFPQYSDFHNDLVKNYITVESSPTYINPLEVSYLTQGLEWSCTYRFILNEQGNQIVSGTLNACILNRTNLLFDNVIGELILGDVKPPSKDDISNESYQHFSSQARSFNLEHEGDTFSNQYMRLQIPHVLSIPPFHRIDVNLLQFRNYPILPYYIYELDNKSNNVLYNYQSDNLTRASWGIYLSSRKYPFPSGKVAVYQQCFTREWQSIQEKMLDSDLNTSTNKDNKEENKDNNLTLPENNSKNVQKLWIPNTGTYIGSSRIQNAMKPKKDKIKLNLGKSERLYGKYKIEYNHNDGGSDHNNSSLDSDVDINNTKLNDISVQLDINLLAEAELACDSQIYIKYTCPLPNARVHIEQIEIKSTSNTVQLLPYSHINDILLFSLENINQREYMQILIQLHMTTKC